ncbi:MAG: DJ-1 family glyoxalase III [Verrucomicrobiota bacterium]|nr:DJ-1 family glyoxalase III [Verrucomicrobiota bacterium]
MIILAPGFEEIEAITPIDILRRAGAEVIVAGLVEGPIEASRKTRHLADVPLEQIVSHEGYDMLVLPGGQPGTNHLLASEKVVALVAQFARAEKWIAAICAAPSVLAKAGVLNGSTYTCHPGAVGLVNDLSPAGIAPIRDSSARVVQKAKVITSLAAGSSMEFSFKLVEALFGPEKVREVNQGVLAPGM